jgi:glutamate formiminotransferase/formiminotetrahydrofolate cyclodeaminase
VQQLIECVPNFSEGRDLTIIKGITDQISSVAGVQLLDVDPGAATNRTVVTMAGSPEAVLEAAFRAIKQAKATIDMRHHKGEHPRFGATDVCPIIPVSGVTMEQAAEYARQLAERVARELNYPVYLYEAAASSPARRNLADVRSGEYEGLANKLNNPDWKPDFGPTTFVPETGATAIGARDFLIALNFNLNTTSTRRANAVAFDVREAGRLIKEKQPDGTITEIRQPGTLKAAKAIGWLIEEYGIAQVSMNLTNISITSVHEAFDAVVASATARGLRVTGTEIVGLVPLSVLTDAGRHYLRKQERSVGVSDAELIKIAVKSMGLDDLKPFDPARKVLEYLLADPKQSRLVNMTVADFVNETSSESPAPGGGSVSAVLGSLAAALSNMVANLSSHKRAWDDQWAYFSDIADQGMALQRQLIALVDEDTRSFELVMEAFGLPKATPDEKAQRKHAIAEATLYATQIPLRVMETSLATMPLLAAMAERGNPNSVSDAGVGVLCARAAVRGAGLNVRINATGLDQTNPTVIEILARATALEQAAADHEVAIMAVVMGKV